VTPSHLLLSLRSSVGISSPKPTRKAISGLNPSLARCSDAVPPREVLASRLQTGSHCVVRASD